MDIRDTSEESFVKCAIEHTIEWTLCCRGKFTMNRVPQALKDALSWVPSVIRQATIDTFRRFDEETAHSDVWICGGNGISTTVGMGQQSDMTTDFQKDTFKEK